MNRRRFLKCTLGAASVAGSALAAYYLWMPVTELVVPESTATTIPNRMTNGPPVADFSLDYAPRYYYPTTEQVIHFTDCSIDPDNDELKYTWSTGKLGDTGRYDERVVSGGKDLDIVLPEGDHYVELKVTDGQLTGRKEVAITVVGEHKLPRLFYDNMHVDYVRAHWNEEPYNKGFTRLLSDANHARTIEPKPIRGAWYVPMFYEDRAGRDRAIAPLEESAHAMTLCANAFMMTRNRKYASKIVEIAGAWTGSLMNIASKQASYEAHWFLQEMAVASHIVKDFEDWDEEEKKSYIDWHVGRVKYLLDLGTSLNNHTYWLACQAMSVGVLGQRQELIQRSIDVAKNAIRHDVETDGHLPRETARGYRGIHYQNFALDALFFLSEMAYNSGVDLYSYEPNGRSLRLAADYLLKYLGNPGAWPWSYIKQDLSGIWGSVGWLEFAYYRWRDPSYEKWLKLKRPIRDWWTGGYTTMTHGTKFPE